MKHLIKKRVEIIKEFFNLTYRQAKTAVSLHGRRKVIGLRAAECEQARNSELEDMFLNLRTHTRFMSS